MKLLKIVTAAGAALSLVLLVGSFLTEPTRRLQFVQEAKNHALSSTGIWIYQGQQTFISPHDDIGAFTQTRNIISRPGGSEELLFRLDSALEKAPKGTRFKLVFHNPDIESQLWDDYLEVKLVD